MPLSNYNTLYLITNIIYIYTLYRYVRVFCNQRRVSIKIEVLAYILAYFFIGFIYLFIDVPVVTLVSNMLMFYALTLVYKASQKSRLLAVIFSYLTFFCSELFVMAVGGYYKINDFFDKGEYSSLTGIILCRLLAFMIVLLIENYSNLRKGSEIPTSSWLSIIFIPLGSFYIIFYILTIYSDRAVTLVMCVFILLVINIITFYLYDALSVFYREKIDRILLKQQNEYYAKQLEIMNSSYENARSIRHDIKNHLIALESYIKQENSEKAIEYISQIITASYGERALVSTGNVDIDSILNYKLEEARSKDIEVILDLNIPKEINIETLDIVSILGNLLDNAINANLKLKEGRKIALSIKYNRNLLIISTSNPFDGNIVYSGNRITTTHTDKESHGIGLNNINNILNRYDGTMEITHENSIFKVDIILYLS